MPMLDYAVPRRTSRRSMLRMSGASAVACPICLSSLLRAPGAHAAPHWGHEGAGAPQNEDTDKTTSCATRSIH